MAWKAGYKFYIPNEKVCWHLWDHSYRPRFMAEGVDISEAEKKKLGVEKVRELEESMGSDKYDN